MITEFIIFLFLGGLVYNLPLFLFCFIGLFMAKRGKNPIIWLLIGLFLMLFSQYGNYYQIMNPNPTSFIQISMADQWANLLKCFFSSIFYFCLFLFFSLKRYNKRKAEKREAEETKGPPLQSSVIEANMSENLRGENCTPSASVMPNDEPQKSDNDNTKRITLKIADLSSSTNQKKCKYCGATIYDDSMFCSKCGKKIENDSNVNLKYCRFCGNKVESNFKYCNKCGKEL